VPDWQCQCPLHNQASRHRQPWRAPGVETGLPPHGQPLPSPRRPRPGRRRARRTGRLLCTPTAKLSPSSSRAREREVPRPPALALAGHGVLARRPPSGCWAGWGRSAVCSASETRHRRTAPRRPTYALSNALGCPSESRPRCPPQSYGTARPS
jgi:hypothetical protein